MSDISISSYHLFLMALIAGSPGFVIGAAAGAFLWRERRLAGLILGAAVGFLLCLGAVYFWITELR